MDKLLKELYEFVLKMNIPINKLHLINGHISRKCPTSTGTIQGWLDGSEVVINPYKKPSECIDRINVIWANYCARSKKERLEVIKDNGTEVMGEVGTAIKFYETLKMDPRVVYSEADDMNKMMFDNFYGQMKVYNTYLNCAWNQNREVMCVDFEKITKEIIEYKWMYDDNTNKLYCLDLLDGLAKGGR